MKDRKYFKPCKITITAYETNEESNSELWICIVFGLFRGMVDGMDGGMICIMTCITYFKQYPKSDVQACEEELLKDKSISSEKSKFLGDESSRLLGELSKK